jgi:hypothetical protein
VIRRVWFPAAVLALPFLFASGCGKGGLVKVQGTVTLDGKPLDGATVIFVPEGEGGVTANGLTGSDGVFRLTTRTSGDGALPGQYKVTITKAQAVEAADQATPSDPKSMIDAMKDYQAKHAKGPATKAGGTVPAQYADVKKTPLKCQVPPDAPLVFELRSAGGS